MFVISPRKMSRRILERRISMNVYVNYNTWQVKCVKFSLRLVARSYKESKRLKVAQSYKESQENVEDIES
jgi:hypothetical protein